MSYSELLQKREWIEKSASIIQRDSFKCQKCGSIGFHNISMCICKDSQELDGFFDGWTFNGLPFSAFIEKERQSSSNSKQYKLSVKPIYTFNNEEGLKINGYGFYRLSSFDDVDRTVYCCCPKIPDANPIYSRHFRDESKDGVYGRDLKIEKLGGEVIYLDWGNTYVFSQNILDSYAVSIQYVYPTGVAWDYYVYPKGAGGNDMPVFYGSIVVNITYKNFVGSFYFIPKEIKGLNVHHKYYIKGKAPWEYEDDALVTLCEECHRETHRTTRIPIYRNYNATKIECGTAIPCSRCNGSGYLPQYQHVEDGICFQCWGEGVVIDDL